MDLKEVIATVNEKAMEAHKAFHAGHHDTAEGYLGEVRLVIEAYWMEKRKPGQDITGKATSEKPDESLEETQAKVSGPGVQPAVIDPVPPPGPALPASQFEKPTQ